MSGQSDSGGRRRLIDAAAKARFPAALRAGEHRAEAARAVGFTLTGLYNARSRDPAFGLAWTWALELSAADEQAARRADRADRAEAGPVGDDMTIRFAPQRGRWVQRRRMRWVRFTEARRQVFLDHFAGTADATEAAEAAGVSYSTVSLHRRRDPDFAERWGDALQLAYPRLEAEALRQRLEAQRRLREEIMPEGEIAQEFDRVMKLLARWDRRGGGIGPRQVSHGRRKGWTFERAVEALDKRLRALGIPIVGEQEKWVVGGGQSS